MIRIGRSIASTIEITEQVNGIKKESRSRSRRSCEKDMKLLIKQLFEDTNVFDTVSKRAHQSFMAVDTNPINTWPAKI